MVGGLVEEQQVRSNEQEFAQFDAHLPTAAEFAHFPVHVRRPEAEALQHALGLFLLGAGAHEGELVVGFAQAVDQPAIGLALVIGALGNFRGDAGDLGFELLVDGEGALGFLKDGRFLVVLHLLGQVADAVFLRGGDVALVRVLDAGDDLEEGGLARPIASDEAHPVLVAHGQRDVFEEGALSEMDADLVQVEHGAGGNEKRPQRWAFLGVLSGRDQ